MPCSGRTGLAVILGLLAACSQATATKEPIGGPCNGQDSNCSSGLCVSVDTQTTLCSRVCTTNSDCPSSFLCATIEDVGMVCLPAGLNGRCTSDVQCSAGFLCDTTAGACYIPVDRGLCDPCTSSKQCFNGDGVCRQDGNAQTCTEPCSTSTPCPTGYSCTAVAGATMSQCLPQNMDQTCGADEGLCGPCHSSADCGGSGSSCVRNLASNEMFCGTACKVDSDCPAAFNCTDLSGVGTGPDVCVPNSGTCVGYCDSSDPGLVRQQCGIALGCNLTTRTCEPLTMGVCTPCMTDDDCVASGSNYSCLEDQCTNCPFTGQKFCSVQCSSSAPCEAGFTCSQVGTQVDAPFYCIPESGSCTAGGGQLGDDCSALGANACLSGLCVSLGTEAVCSTTCMTQTDCGNAQFLCCALSSDGNSFDCTQMPGANGGICAPSGGAFGADCSPGQPPCFNGVCLDLGTADVCTTTCTTSTDCTSGFTCRQGEESNGDGTSTQLQVCFPNGGGGLGADCTFGPAACQSGLCLEKNTGNICTESCASATCPGGYHCLSEALSANATKDTQVCVPNGT